MLKIRLTKRVFWCRLALMLLTGLFVIPAYLFYLPEDFSEENDSALSFQTEHDQVHSALPITTAPESFKTENPEQTLAVGPEFNQASTASQAEAADVSLQVKNLLSGLLSDYQSPELTPDQKHEISSILPEINQTPAGRNLIVSFFFYEQDPEIAAAMYDMILDARLKDPGLISELISRDESEFNNDYKARLIDLVADHNTVKQTYNQKIEEFLESMSLHPDAALRQASVAQWAWYVNEHKGILPVLDAYLFSHSSQVRAEVYEMIELDAIQNVSEKREVALALEALSHAHYLSLDEQEKTRIEALKARLSL